MKRVKIFSDYQSVTIHCAHCDNWEETGIDDPRHRFKAIPVVEWVTEEIEDNNLSINKCCECENIFTVEWDYKNPYQSDVMMYVLQVEYHGVIQEPELFLEESKAFDCFEIKAVSESSFRKRFKKESFGHYKSSYKEAMDLEGNERYWITDKTIIRCWEVNHPGEVEHFLMGEDAGRNYEDGGVEEVIASCDSIVCLSFSPETQASTILYEADGWFSFVKITKEECDTLNDAAE